MAAAWTPSSEELAYWRFLRLSGRPVVASRCLVDGLLEMAALPADPLMSAAFFARHAGHQLVRVTPELDRLLRLGGP